MRKITVMPLQPFTFTETEEVDQAYCLKMAKGVEVFDVDQIVEASFSLINVEKVVVNAYTGVMFLVEVNDV